MLSAETLHVVLTPRMQLKNNSTSVDLTSIDHYTKGCTSIVLCKQPTNTALKMSPSFHDVQPMRQIRLFESHSTRWLTAILPIRNCLDMPQERLTNTASPQSCLGFSSTVTGRESALQSVFTSTGGKSALSFKLAAKRNVQLEFRSHAGAGFRRTLSQVGHPSQPQFEVFSELTAVSSSDSSFLSCFKKSRVWPIGVKRIGAARFGRSSEYK